MMSKHRTRAGGSLRNQQPFTNLMPSQTKWEDAPLNPAGQAATGVTINFITPPVRCKVYQPMELRCDGVRVTPGTISAELQSFNPKTPKSHKAAQKLEDSGHRVLVKIHSAGGIHLRFPVAGHWALSVEYNGATYTKNIEVFGQRGKHAKLQSKPAAEALYPRTGDEHILESEDSLEDTSVTSGSKHSPNETSDGTTMSDGTPSSPLDMYHLESDGNLSMNISLNDWDQQPASARASTNWNTGTVSKDHWRTSSGGDWKTQAQGSAAYGNLGNPYIRFQGNSNLTSRQLNYAQMMYQRQQMVQQQQQKQQQKQQQHQQYPKHSHSRHSRYTNSMTTFEGASQHISQPQQVKPERESGNTSPPLMRGEQPSFGLHNTAYYEASAPNTSNGIITLSQSQGLSSLQQQQQQQPQWQQQQQQQPQWQQQQQQSSVYESSSDYPSVRSPYATGLGNYMQTSQLNESPMAEVVLTQVMSTTPDSSTFAYNNMGQYANAAQIKSQDSEINYIQPDAVYYPIPPACYDDVVNSFFADQPTSPDNSSHDTSSSEAAAPVVTSGYHFFSRIVPSSTSDVVSWGQEVCLIGQNFVDKDEANSIFFTLQINNSRIKTPIQHSKTTNHLATIPPLSYFGVSYSLEPLMAAVELYQYSLLVPCDQQFYYLSTSGQVQQVQQSRSNSKDAEDRNNGGHHGGSGGNHHDNPNSGGNNGSDGNNNSGSSDGSSPSPDTPSGTYFYFNNGIPSLNTLIVDNNLKAVQELVSKGADPDKADIWGITPLHLAIFFGRLHIADYLLKTGVEKSLQTEDINGDTPLDLVIRHWDPQIRQLYDVMVSLLRDTSSMVQPANVELGEVSISTNKKPHVSVKRPSFSTRRSNSAIKKDSSLSSALPFHLKGGVLTVLDANFWSELHIALDRLKMPIASLGLTPEETLVLESWSHITSAKSILSSNMSLDTFPNVPVHAFPVLENLDLSSNSVKFLPSDFGDKFKSLAGLDMTNNLLDILPGTLASLPSLKTFSYAKNPLRLMPKQVVNLPAPVLVEGGSPRVSSPIPTNSPSHKSTSLPKMAVDWQKAPLRQYLQELGVGVAEKISDSKVRINIFGENYVDRRTLQKTLQVDFGSFVTRLRYKVPQIVPSDDLSVEDAKIGMESFESWTAGARHTSYACQTLITPGIQLVVFSLLHREARDLAMIQYWIQAIRSRMSSVPIILIACHSEAVNTSLREVAGFMERVSGLLHVINQTYPNVTPIEDIMAVSFSNGDGFDALKKKLLECTSKHGFASKIYRKNVVLLAETLVNLKQARWFLTRSEFTSLAAQFGVDSSNGSNGSNTIGSNFEELILQLSSLAGVIHFADHSELLANYVFLEPQRLCHALSNFYVRYKRLLKDGILHLEDCRPPFAALIGGLPVAPIEQGTITTIPVTSLPESNNNATSSAASSSRSRTSPGNSPPGSNSALSNSSSSPTSSPSPRPLDRVGSGELIGGVQANGGANLTLGGQHLLSAMESSTNELPRSSNPARNSKGFLTNPIRNASSKSLAYSSNSLISHCILDDLVLVDLLEMFNEAIKLPHRVLFPQRLSDSPSNDLLLQYWSLGPSHSFERIYHFKGSTPPKQFVNKLYARLYEDLRIEVCLHWSGGLILRHLGDSARLTLALNTPIIHIQVVGGLPNPFLPIIVKIVDELVASICPSSLLQTLVPCPSLTSTSTTLLKEDILAVLSEGQHQLTRDKFAIRLDLVAPDLSLHDLQANEVDEAALTVTESNLSVMDAFDAKEAHGSSLVAEFDGRLVWKGKLRGAEDVLISHFHRDVDPSQFKTKAEYMTQVQNSYIKSMEECSSEIRKLVDLNHSGLVRLRSFSLVSQSMATESSAHGSLQQLLVKHSTSTSNTTPLTPELKLRMMIEIAQVVNWLSNKNLKHSQLTTSNILVTSLDIKPQDTHIKLCNLDCVERLSDARGVQQTCKALGLIFWQIWTGNSDTSGFSLELVSKPSSNFKKSEVFDLVHSCGRPTEPATVSEVVEHLEFIFAHNNLLLPNLLPSMTTRSGSSAVVTSTPYAYWLSETSVRILELGEKVVASVSAIIQSPAGTVWVASASGYIYLWNPNDSSTSESSTKTVIQTFSVDTRQSRRRINALMTSGNGVWCVTDGSINVYTSDGQLVKSITHKQSLCMAKYEPIGKPSLTGMSAMRTPPKDGLVYIGGAHGEISVWDSTTLQSTLGVVLENRLPITSIAVDSKYLWIGVGVSKRVCHVVALNKKTLVEICRFQAHEDLVSSIVVVDDSHLWTSSFDGKINVWNVDSESENKVSVKLEKSIMTHRKPILKMVGGPRAPDGSVNKIFASDHSEILVWSTKNTHTIEKNLLGRHRGAIGALCSVDDNTFISASVQDGCVCLWKRSDPLRN